MKLDIVYDCSKIDWQAVRELLKRVGMAYETPEVHRRAFEASHTTVFVYRAGQLVGFGRAISDGAYQAAVYDVAVVPEYQRMGIGKTLMGKILERLRDVSGTDVGRGVGPGGTALPSANALRPIAFETKSGMSPT